MPRISFFGNKSKWSYESEVHMKFHLLVQLFSQLILIFQQVSNSSSPPRPMEEEFSMTQDERANDVRWGEADSPPRPKYSLFSNK